MRNRKVTVKDCVQRGKWIEEPTLEVDEKCEKVVYDLNSENGSTFGYSSATGDGISAIGGSSSNGGTNYTPCESYIEAISTSYIEGAGCISGSRGTSPKDDCFEIYSALDDTQNGMEMEFSEPSQITVSVQGGADSNESQISGTSHISATTSPISTKSQTLE